MSSTAVERLYGSAVAMVLLVVALLSFTKPIPSEPPLKEQAALFEDMPAAEPGPPPVAVPVEEGEGLAYIRIPRFGDEWLWAVVEGTTMDHLAKGPGHFIASALPGEVGNTAYAAHRSGHGDPFLDFDKLEEGDKIIVAQSGAEWTYQLRFAPRIIEADEHWVVGQTTRAGRPFQKPRLTLVTCWPKYGSEKRLYVRAELLDVL